MEEIMSFADYLKPLEKYHQDFPMNMEYNGYSVIKFVDLVKEDQCVVIEHFIGKYRVLERLSRKYYTGMNSEKLLRVFARLIKDNNGSLERADELSNQMPNAPAFLCLIEVMNEMINAGISIKVPVHIMPDGKYRKIIYYPEGVKDER